MIVNGLDHSGLSLNNLTEGYGIPSEFDQFLNVVIGDSFRAEVAQGFEGHVNVRLESYPTFEISSARQVDGNWSAGDFNPTFDHSNYPYDEFQMIEVIEFCLDSAGNSVSNTVVIED